MFLVVDANLFTHPFRSPNLLLLVVVSFCMRYTFWRRVGKAIAAKLFAMRTVSRVDDPFIQIPAAASLCTIFASILWQRTARWRRWSSTAVPMTASPLVFLASSRLVTRFSHRAFAVGRCSHHTLVIAVSGGVVGWWLLHQLLQHINA